MIEITGNVNEDGSSVVKDYGAAVIKPKGGNSWRSRRQRNAVMQGQLEAAERRGFKHIYSCCKCNHRVTKKARALQRNKFVNRIDNLLCANCLGGLG